MKLKVKIHESHINQVQLGQPAFVVLDSMPDQRFRGVVNKVAPLPDSQSRWGNPDLKVYATEILVTDKLPDVKPGVSARAEVIITNLPDALTVPIQAVTTRKGKQVVFRSDRTEKDRLQLYVINADGTGEAALTDNDKWVYWAPYWYKDGKHIIYTAADHTDPLARPNYDLFWMTLATKKVTRLTFAPGQDVLPVFSPDGTKVMWTSSRDGRSPTQLYIADFAPPKGE